MLSHRFYTTLLANVTAISMPQRNDGEHTGPGRNSGDPDLHSLALGLPP